MGRTRTIIHILQKKRVKLAKIPSQRKEEIEENVEMVVRTVICHFQNAPPGLRHVHCLHGSPTEVSRAVRAGSQTLPGRPGLPGGSPGASSGQCLGTRVKLNLAFLVVAKDSPLGAA